MGTPTVIRPQKVGNVRTYVDEVNYLAPADAPILAPEVDADLDTLYNAWNNPASTFPPSGGAGGDLAGSSFPNPVVAPAAITTPKLADGAAVRAKIGADAWLSPVPTGADVGKVLGVAAGPTLAYQAAGGPPSGAAGGDLAGSSYPSPVLAANAVTSTKLAAGAVGSRELADLGVATGDLADLAVTTAKLANQAVTLGKLAIGASVRQAPVFAIPANANITAIGAWTDLMTASITTSGGLVVAIAVPGWWAVGNLNVVNGVLTGIGRDQVTPNIVAGEHRFQLGGTGVWVVPLPMLIGVDAAPAGAHVYHLVVWNTATGVSTVTGASWPGNVWLVELA